MTITILQAQPQGSGMGSLLFLLGFFAIFFLFMIRPQMKKAKEQKKFQEAVKIGDRIMTIGGIHGEVIETDETTVVIKLDQGRMRIEKAALSVTKEISEGQGK